MVSQDYVTRVHEIDVILGNSGLLKCEIPSFVIDFVSVINWLDNQGEEYFMSQNTGITFHFPRFFFARWDTQASSGP